MKHAFMGFIVSLCAIPVHHAIALVYSAQGNVSYALGEHYRYTPFDNLFQQGLTQFYYYANGLQASEQNISVCKIRYYDLHQHVINQIKGPRWVHYWVVKQTPLLRDGVVAVLLLTNRHQSIMALLQSHHVSVWQYSPYGTPLLTPHDGLGYARYFCQHQGRRCYLSARYYDVGLRSFLSYDSQDLSNHYFYGGESPLGGRDPSGHVFEDLPEDAQWHILSFLDRRTWRKFGQTSHTYHDVWLASFDAYSGDRYLGVRHVLQQPARVPEPIDMGRLLDFLAKEYFKAPSLITKNRVPIAGLMLPTSYAKMVGYGEDAFQDALTVSWWSSCISPEARPSDIVVLPSSGSPIADRAKFYNKYHIGWRPKQKLYIRLEQRFVQGSELMFEYTMDVDLDKDITHDKTR